MLELWLVGYSYKETARMLGAGCAPARPWALAR
jgi:hypothetical protein